VSHGVGGGLTERRYSGVVEVDQALRDGELVAIAAPDGNRRVGDSFGETHLIYYTYNTLRFILNLAGAA
jgi:hypothetical protein